MYERVTEGIRVSVEPSFLEDQSDPRSGRFMWAYRVRIHNGAETAVQVRTRHWKITDSWGRTEEVRGEGVVGEQPVIAPGEAFEYTSGAPLPTPSGLMVGRYGVEWVGTGAKFEIDIPAFSLDSPHDVRRVH
ncbi:MAG: Co2+/Mg2+ efflux protein ApaG [Parvularculaceae bacterium]|nr:Co2+/Mg2+ efflux protein ApaG [Parvularculaceae bacterium]